MWERDEDHQKTKVGESVRRNKFANDFLQDSPQHHAHIGDKRHHTSISLVNSLWTTTTWKTPHHSSREPQGKVPPRGAHIFTDNQEHTVFFDYSLEKSH